MAKQPTERPGEASRRPSIDPPTARRTSQAAGEIADLGTSQSRRETTKAWSLRRQLLVGILAPVLALVALNAVLLYEQALSAADTAYDRTLLASAKSLGELLTVHTDERGSRIESTVLYSALEPFEADNRSRLYYRVTGFQGEHVSGFDDLPAWQGRLPTQGPYAALVDFYDDEYRGEPVRVAVLLQPVAGVGGQGMATIQVAETLELRHTLARQILVDTLWRQALLVLVIALVVIWVVQRVTRPVRALSEQLRHRGAADLDALHLPDAPRELSPLVDATNHVMARLRTVLDNQKRFVRDASHQLRTPLAVLKTQVQSALRGDVEPRTALTEINATVDRATELANQMLALAKVEQLREAARMGAEGPGSGSGWGLSQGTNAPAAETPIEDWAQTVRDVALDLAPLMVEQRIEFDIRTEPAWIASHAWPLRELTRNLLHNAIRFSPDGAALTVTLTLKQTTTANVTLHAMLRGGLSFGSEGATAGSQLTAPPDGAAAAADFAADPNAAPATMAELRIRDGGPGLSAAQRDRLFIPFATSAPPSRGAGSPLSAGSGLGLVICHGIVESLGGHLTLDNRAEVDRHGDGRRSGTVVGLDAVVTLPCVAAPLGVSAPESSSQLNGQTSVVSTTVPTTSPMRNPSRPMNVS